MPYAIPLVYRHVDRLFCHSNWPCWTSPGFALSGAVESVGIWNLRQGVQEIESGDVWRNPWNLAFPPKKYEGYSSYSCYCIVVTVIVIYGIGHQL